MNFVRYHPLRSHYKKIVQLSNSTELQNYDIRRIGYARLPNDWVDIEQVNMQLATILSVAMHSDLYKIFMEISFDTKGYIYLVKDEDTPLWMQRSDISPRVYWHAVGTDEVVCQYKWSIDCIPKGVTEMVEKAAKYDALFSSTSMAHPKRSFIEDTTMVVQASPSRIEHIKSLINPTLHIFLDTETTTVPSKKPNFLPSDINKFPMSWFKEVYCLQVSYTVRDALTSHVLEKNTYLIKPPDSYTGTPYDKALFDRCRYEGVPVEVAMNSIIKWTCTTIPIMLICHNVQFDKSIIACELARLRSHSYSRWVTFPSFCTMLQAAQHMENKKWPKLQSLHDTLDLPKKKQTHLADDDVLMMIECYDKMKTNGWMLNKNS